VKPAFGLAMSLVLGAPAWAAQPPPAPPAAAAQLPASPHKMELVHRYLTAIHYDAMVERMFAILLPPIMKLALSQAPDVTAEQRADLTEAANIALAEWHSTYVGRFEVEIARLYTEEELQAALAFYESPVGKSIVAKQSELSKAGVRIGTELQPELKRLLVTQICKKLDCSKLKQPPLDKKS
jgi:hypothetical protein